jgi:hypothetical protein
LAFQISSNQRVASSLGVMQGWFSAVMGLVFWGGWELFSNRLRDFRGLRHWIDGAQGVWLGSGWACCRPWSRKGVFGVRQGLMAGVGFTNNWVLGKSVIWVKLKGGGGRVAFGFGGACLLG